MIPTRALRNDSLSFLGAYDAACFLPFAPGGLGGDTLPLLASHVLLRICLGLLPYPANIKILNYKLISLLLKMIYSIIQKMTDAYMYSEKGNLSAPIRSQN